MKRPYLLWMSTDNAAALLPYLDDTRLFDIAVHDYAPDKIWWHVGMGEHYFRAAGEKLKSAAKFLPTISAHYRYVAIWDDDITCETDRLNKLFQVGDGLSLPLYQPSLTCNSFGSWNDLFQYMGFESFPVRKVPFVEIMCPIFSMTALLECLPMFDFNESGWGLDLWDWPRRVNGRTYVIDTLPVGHMREPSRRERVLANGLTPKQELWIADKAFGPNRGPVQPPTRSSVLAEV